MDFKQQVKMITDAHIDAKVQVLGDMLCEIREQEYTSVAQIRGSMISQIESLEKLRLTHE